MKKRQTILSHEEVKGYEKYYHVWILINQEKQIFTINTILGKNQFDHLASFYERQNLTYLDPFEYNLCCLSSEEAGSLIEKMDDMIERAEELIEK